MKGFSGVIHTNNPERLQRSYGQYNLKFPEDKLNRADEAWDIMFDGVLLNKTQLLREYFCQDLEELLILLWETHGADITGLLKGSYVLSLWDKKQDVVLVTGDRLNKRPLYYHMAGNTVCFSSRYLDLVTLLAEQGVACSYSHAAFAMLQSSGQIYDNFTPLQGVYCLRPFEYLLCRNGAVELVRAEPQPKEAQASEEELLAEFNRLFARAVELQYEKNRDSGYEQVASLSGGMDSRSTVLMGQKLGYALDRSFCYCQSGAADEKIARKLAEKLQAPFHFLPLDGGDFLLRPEEHGRRNECMISYGGSTGALTMAETMPLDRVGIIHAGLFGGEIMSSIFQAEDPQLPRDRFSGPAREEFAACLEYCASESLMYLRQLMRGCMNFVRMFESKAEVLSPFMDEDVYAFLLTVPFHMRKARMFYARWMRRYLPNSLMTTYYRAPMNAPEFVLQFMPRFFDRVHLRLKGFDMHPMQRWYDEQPALRESLQRLTEHYAHNHLPEEIRRPLLEQAASADPMKIMYALTGLLAAWLTEEAQKEGYEGTA